MNNLWAMLLRWCLGALIAISAVSASANAGEPHYLVGVAAVDVTPSYSIRLNGFGFRRTESEGITQPIYAKAIAIGADDERPLVLITLDSLGIRLDMVEEVARRLEKAAGIQRERFAVTFTHSHTTPKVNGASDTIFGMPIPAEHQANIDRYTKELTDSLEKVALAALAARRPARLDWAIGKVGFAKNRRPQGGPVDHDLPMLVIKDADSGAIRAIYVTYACHCVTLSSNFISGDWAGFAQKAIESKHPGAIALVSIGCGSDSNPSSGVVGDKSAVAAEQGGEIAGEVERLLRVPLTPVTGPVRATLNTIELPLNQLPSRDEIAATAAEATPAGYNAQYQLAKLNRGEPLSAAIEYPVQTWSFGDSLTMVFLAGEVCADYSVRLRNELDATRLWLHGYANDFCCYIPSERLLAEGGYGGGAEIVYFALPTTLAPGLEEKIIAEVHAQVPKQFVRDSAAEKQGHLMPTSPDNALAAIHVDDEFVVELMAAEPLIATPVAIDFGGDGRLWVAEMPDYSRDVDDQFDPSGTIKVLADRDGDGRFDQASPFATGLRFPTDVKVWGKGAIVCDAPDVIYFEDGDGDGRAEIRSILLTGFATHNAQARVNSVRWGIDNWLYGSCGLFGGNIRSFSGRQIDLGSRDFRMWPASGVIEAVTGKTQQGRACDDWGNWFGCENGCLAKHYPVSDKYLARNPHIAPPATEVVVATGNDPNRLFPIGQPVLFKLSGAPGRPTSACGLEIYRDELLGTEFRGNLFVAEPVNQLIHRRVLAPRGVTFVGERAPEESQREFLASTDPWFRPVQVRTGLDGCLWIVDICRYVIEHPRFIPAETLATLDPMAGRAAGRIYRVRPRHAPPRPAPRLDTLDTPGLVAALNSPNGPVRDLAQQRLLEHGDAAAVPQLKSMVAGAERPETRLQALCTLDGLDALDTATVLTALQDSANPVRRHAIRVSEPFVSDSAAVGEAWAALANAPDPQVRLQLAYSLGSWQNPRASELLARLATDKDTDAYLKSAVLSSVNRDNAAEVVQAMLANCRADKLSDNLLDAVILIATKIGDDNCLRTTLSKLCPPGDNQLPAADLEALATFLERLDSRQLALVGQGDAASAGDLAWLVSAARKIAAAAESEPRQLIAAVRILARAAPQEPLVRDTLSEWLAPHSSTELQDAAATLVAQLDGPQAGEILLENWASYTPALRSRALGILLGRDELLAAFLSEIQSGRIKAPQLDAAQLQRLLTHANPKIRAAATAAFAASVSPDRQKVIDGYAAAATLAGTVAHGRALFRTHCSSCHRLEEQGSAVGPDLAALTNRSPAAFLESLFDPNRTIDERYVSYVAVSDEGVTYNGILADETSNSITLVEQQGKKHTLLRNTLEDFASSGISLMPEGLEKNLSVADVADLFAYLGTQVTQP